MTLVVLGDALLDRDIHGTAERLSPDAPTAVLDEAYSLVRPGGAALAATLAARDGLAVTLVSAFGSDKAASELRAELDRHNVEVVDIGLRGATPEKIRFFAAGQQLLRLDRGGGGTPGSGASAAVRAAVGWADAVLVSDYGRAVASQPQLREALAELPERVPVVWDPHPRGARPPRGLAVATPNRAELERFAPSYRCGEQEPGLVEQCEQLRRSWQLHALCVTLGARGALLVADGAEPLPVPTTAADGGDPCGAGDRFASRLAGSLGSGRALADAAREAVACASAYVASGGAYRALREGQGGLDSAQPDALELAAKVRARGGTVIATGGCFDLLHAGHIRTLQDARRLGDCLIVCLNSDASVRRLKGPSRPVVPEYDRAAVLTALSCVDAVAVFDEDTPEQVLRALRPHV
ncbi:MAG: bifunctional heptose 7-phosphate kinase/heptose 1-phosphate adenyltransferase, partial [Solirubrobacterales bacterium]|nr:bifunctional heptose 7-phosphate kinase/heptose 1-phosphate adenyltransferase [Solirubrobacterales bacterium]